MKKKLLLLVLSVLISALAFTQESTTVKTPLKDIQAFPENTFDQVFTKYVAYMNFPRLGYMKGAWFDIESQVFRIAFHPTRYLKDMQINMNHVLSMGEGNDAEDSWLLFHIAPEYRCYYNEIDGLISIRWFTVDDDRVTQQMIHDLDGHEMGRLMNKINIMLKRRYERGENSSCTFVAEDYKDSKGELHQFEVNPLAEITLKSKGKILNAYFLSFIRSEDQDELKYQRFSAWGDYLAIRGHSLKLVDPSLSDSKIVTVKTSEFGTLYQPSEAIPGMLAIDLDNDGNDELLVFTTKMISPHFELYFYRVKGLELEKLHRILGSDLISNYGDIKSMEWDGKDLKVAGTSIVDIYTRELKKSEEISKRLEEKFKK